MNVLKSSYSELHSLIRYLPNINPNDKELFHGIYLTKKMTKAQELQWKEVIESRQLINDNQTFLLNLLTNCYRKNRSNIILIDIDMKNKILSKNSFEYDYYVKKNSTIEHLCLSDLWIKRRQCIADDAFVYLLSEFTIVECLTRKRQLFIQLSGTRETFFNIPYYITRTSKEKQRNDLRLNKLSTRKRTVQFHLQATKQGQQAHLTDLYETLIDRNMIQYHVSKHEQFDPSHPIEKSLDAQVFVDTWFKSDFSKSFFSHRPKEEVVRK